MKIVESECDCERCSNMCRAPCCGTPAEVEKLIKLGYGSRLMLDDDPCDVNPAPMIKPALKGYEGDRAPYHVYSEEGCTFWKKGKCELHDKKLKPYLGRVAHHAAPVGHYEEASHKLIKSWRTKKATGLIKRFKKATGIGERE